MTQFRQPKKLIEVALPLDAINAASAREKSIRHGHPSTLHLWWARRPLAAARAVIFAQMVDDPSAWPELFPTEAAQEAERQRLFRLIEQLVQWENTTNEDLLRQAREEIWKSWRRTCAAVRSEERGARSERSAGRWERSEERAEREERGKGGEERAERGVDEDGGRLALFDPDKLPAFHDPFAGGGALPLEAQRLGLESYASDLNPVAVLINKAMIEIPPKFAGMPPVGGRSEGREVRSEGREGRSEIGERGVRSEIGEREVRSEIGEEDALSGNDPLAESDGGSARSVSAGAAPAQGGNLRDALADHTGSNLGSGEHSGGLDPRIQQGQGAVPGGRPGVPGGSGDVADALRGPGLVPDARNEPAALDAGRGQSHVDNDAAETSRGLTSHSSLLFPLSYKGAQGLAEDVRYYGRWMRDEAEKRIGHLYPKIEITAEMVRERPDLKPYLGQKLTVIAWLWARTVKSPNPAFAHVDVPLASTFILSSKPGKEAYVEPVIGTRSEERGTRSEERGTRSEERGTRSEERGTRGEEQGTRSEEGGTRSEERGTRSEERGTRSEERGNSDERLFPTSSFLSPPSSFLSPPTGYRFAVRVGKPPEWARNGTKLARGANFRCLMSDMPITGDYIKAEGQAGRMGARLMAIVAEGERGRVYLPPTPEHEAIARSAQPEWEPEAEIAPDRRSMFTPLYGLTHFKHLFTPRQLVALTTFADLVGEAMERVKRDYLGARASRPPSPPSPVSQPPAPHKGWHSRGYHPHVDQPAVIQSITFRLHDSVPSALLQQWRDELRIIEGLTKDDARMAELRRRLDAYEDAGHGACWLRDPRIAELVEHALLHFDGERYRLLEWCIMPNHVHVLIETLPGYRLSEIVHAWKSFTAKEANRLLGRTGAFWMADYYDRYVRDEAHLAAVRAYIRENPVKAGLCARPEEWRWSSAAVGAEAGGTPAHPGGGGPPASMAAREPLSARASGPPGVGGPPAYPGDDDRPLHAGGTGATAYAQAVGVYLAFGVDRLTDRSSTICSWDSGFVKIRNTFGRQAIPMTWDYAEGNPFSDSTGNFLALLEWVEKFLQESPAEPSGWAVQMDASTQSLSANTIISTDPPYYDNIGYADLSDFFYVWLRRALRPVFPDLFATLAVPKAEELVATPYRHGGKEQAERFFMEGMTRALRNLAAQAHPAFPVTIYYAYKQQEVREEQSAKSEQSKKSAKSEQSEQSASLDHTSHSSLLSPHSSPASHSSLLSPHSSLLSPHSSHSSLLSPHSSHSSLLSPHSSTGWETFLEAVIQAGFAISGTWPMRTELGNRMLGQGTNALASSIVLVCRPRPANAPTVTRRDFVAALRAELPAALKAMQRGSIAPVDLAQAAIGPGMAVFTRYGKVLDAGGAPLSVREALALINAALDEALAEQEGDFDAETRWALAWFEQHGFGEGEFGVAETLSKAKNTSVEGLAGAGMVAAKRGKVRLLKPAELAPDWDPSGDARVTHWKGVHYLIRALERGGETAAAELAAKLGSQADVARELAYRLYAICERKKRPAEAWSYNALAQSWPELARLAAQRGAAVQSSMFTAEYAEERRGQE